MDNPSSVLIRTGEKHNSEPIGENKGEGRKDDAGKLPLHLLPFDALEGIAEILEFGAIKYSPRNWENGIAWHRVFRATLGHLWAWWMRKGNDPETGKSHLLNAGCCILFLIAFELRGVGEDTRPPTPNPRG